MIPPRYLWAAVRYVERNPVGAGIVKRAQDYRWSSAAYHCGLSEEDLLVGPAAPLKGSLADWWNTRAAETPLFVGTHFAKLGADLDELRNQGIMLVFIDTPPAVTDTIREVVGHADLVVIPTRPSPHDLRAVGATVDIVEDQDKQMIFAVNAAGPIP